MAESGLRGTTADQDTRFKDKEAAAVKATSFPDHFSQKVDLRKVNVTVLKPWIAQKVTDMIRIEDDVVVEYVIGMLEDKEKPMPDPKKMQVSLLGFMDKYGAAAFMDQLWALLLSAQKTVGGVPAEFIAAKKAELERQQMYARTDKKYAERESQTANRATAEDSFGMRQSNDRGLPNRPGGRDDRAGGYRRSSPPRDGRDDGYGRRGGGGGYGGSGGGPRRFDDRPRDSGYGQRRRSPSPERYRRPSPPPRRRSPSPPPRRREPSPRRRSPPARRRSPSPARDRQRERSITPPLRTRRDSPRARKARDDTPPTRRRSPSDSPPPPARRGRSRSRTPTPHDSRDSRSRSRSRSPTVTPPRKRQDSTPPRERTRRRSSTPPRRRRDDTPQSPPAKRRRDEQEEEVVVKKGRGFAAEKQDVPEPPKKKLEGPLAKSKWA